MGENRPDKYRREGSNANIDEAVVSKLLSERRKLQRQQSYRDADAVLAQLTAMNVVVMDKERVWFVQPPRRTDDMKSYRRTGGGGAVDEVLVRKLLDERSVLRAQSDFAGSDALLKQLHAMDVDVIDREGLWSVRRRRARQPSRVATPPASVRTLMRRATTAKDLLAAHALAHPSSEDPLTVNHTDTSLCWGCLGKLARADGRAAARREDALWIEAHPAALRALESATLRGLPRMTARGLATTAHGMAGASCVAPQLWAGVVTEATGRMGEFNSQELANTAWGVATGNREPTPALYAVVAHEVLRDGRLSEFSAQSLANLVWAFATSHEAAPALYAALAIEAEPRLREFKPQELANMMWAFSTAGVAAPALYAAAALEAEPRLDDFKPQELAAMMWAFGVAREAAPPGLEPLRVLDAMEARSGHTVELRYFQMAMSSLVATDTAESRALGSGVLDRLESCTALAVTDGGYYAVFRTLLEACRAADDQSGAARVQAAVERLGIKTGALAPEATACRPGWASPGKTFRNGADDGEGVDDARTLWREVRRRSTYSPQLQSLPWDFVQRSNLHQQEASLMLHAEKKALAVLLHAEKDASPSPLLEIAINFNACIDCHDYFKAASRLLPGRTLRLVQPKMTHSFVDGACSCADMWRWEAREQALRGGPSSAGAKNWDQ